MKILRILVIVTILFLLILPGEGSEIVFEEIGQFNDGGMAVTVPMFVNSTTVWKSWISAILRIS